MKEKSQAKTDLMVTVQLVPGPVMKDDLWSVE